MALIGGGDVLMSGRPRPPALSTRGVALQCITARFSAELEDVGKRPARRSVGNRVVDGVADPDQ